MKSSLRIFVAMAVAILCFASVASAEWRVEIESKTVDAGATGVTLDIKAYWDVSLMGLSVPVVVREIHPGAFWTGDLPYDTNGNAYWKPYSYNVEWKWESPWAGLIEEVRPATPKILSEPCPEGAAEVDTSYDGIAPDNFGISASSSSMPAPATPGGRVVLTLTFDVTDVGGEFEFDTACFFAGLFTIFMVDNQSPPVNHGFGPLGTGEATFAKGIVHIHKDTDGDEVEDQDDNCWLVPNPDQLNSDTDLFGDACDNCPEVDNPAQLDPDSDSIGTACDNCPDHYNPLQEDSDSNGVGDSCQGNAILEFEDAIPEGYTLSQNYPNPFNASTLIEFVLHQGSQVRLEVFDILGQKVTTLVEGNLPPGRHTATWKGNNAKGKAVSSGLYFYRLTAGEFTEMKKMVLMK